LGGCHAGNGDAGGEGGRKKLFHQTHLYAVTDKHMVRRPREQAPDGITTLFIPARMVSISSLLENDCSAIG
jgi:hypothetical protein